MLRSLQVNEGSYQTDLGGCRFFGNALNLEETLPSDGLFAMVRGYWSVPLVFILELDDLCLL